jgi:hypothetical protein
VEKATNELLSLFQSELEKALEIMGTNFKAGRCSLLSGSDLINCVEDLKKEMLSTLPNKKNTDI